MAKLTKEQKEKAAHIWEGIKTGVAKNYYYKVEMIKFYNELNTTTYKVTTSCGSCLETCRRFVESIVTKPKRKKKNVKL